MTTALSESPSSTKDQPVKKREIFGWAMYDFANSSYTTVVVTFVYANFFVNSIVPADSAIQNSYWSIAIALSTILAIVLAPWMGALCDITGFKKRYLMVCTLASVVFTAGLAIVNPGQIWLGIAFLIISNTAWMLSESFNASFLTDLADDHNIGTVSGIGWGIGYIGGLASLIAVMAVITADVGSDTYIQQNQWAMVIVALFYAVGTLPTFLLVRERSNPKPEFSTATLSQILKQGLKHFVDLGSMLRKYPQLFKFFVPFMIYSAGIAIVIKFFGIYASSEMGISGTDLIITGAVLQIASMIGALVFGLIQDRIGAKTTIQLTLLWWTLGILSIYFLDTLTRITGMETVTLFKVLAFVAGSAIGATQSSSRAVVGYLGDKQDSALIFGLWGTFGRLAIVLGMVFGPVSDLVGRHDALLVILAYFIVGAITLAFMNIEKAKVSH
jgi:UMF1 family MFS transporter